MNAEPNSILIVDDDELNSEGLSRRLQRHGYAPTVAKSGREAIELLGKRRFDLVLLDVMMPGMNGLEVLKLLRRVDSLIDLPIIMVTARGESADTVEALELGANDYVTKPVDFPVVLARIRAQLALRRAVSQVTELERKLGARNKELEAVAAKLAEVNQRMTADLEMAARLQQALLPSPPSAVPGANFACAFRPCGQLTGDFLHVFHLDDRHLGLCVLGASRQGIAAALLSLTAGHLLARLTTGLIPPAQVALQLSKHFSEAEAPPFTLFYGILGLDTGELRFTSAGHPGPIHLPRGAPPVQVKAIAPPIGAGAGNYEEQVVILRPDDRLVLYTDGVPEARNAEGEHFGARRFLAALEQARQAPLDQSVAGVMQRIEEWSAGAPQHHDVSILFVERPLEKRAP